MALLAFLFYMLVIKMSLISAHKVSSQFSIYLKIFVNYLQLVSVTASFDLDWPVNISQLLDSQKSAGNISEEIFSLECFQSGEENKQEAFFMKLIVVSCIPILILMSSTLIWTLLALCYSRWTYLKYQMVNSLAVAFFMMHPNIFHVAMNYLNCREIDPGEFWLSSYLTIRCWNGSHSRYAFTAAVPSIIIWGLFTPLGALAALVKLRKQLDSLNTRIRFGFLYTGYKPDKFHWEFVILYRKMLLIIIAVFLTSSISLQALVALLTLVFALILHTMHYPYLTPVLNNLELRGILVGGLTIYCGMFFLTCEVGTGLYILLFVVIILGNAYFLVYWLGKTGRAALELLLKKWTTMCTFLKNMRKSSHIVPNIESSISPNPMKQEPELENWQPELARVPANSLVRSIEELV